MDHVLGGIEYPQDVRSHDGFNNGDPVSLEDQGDQVPVEEDWPAGVRRPRAIVRHTRARSPMNAYEVHQRFADLVDAVCPYGGQQGDGCCTSSHCWCRQTTSRGGLIESDSDDDGAQ